MLPLSDNLAIAGAAWRVAHELTAERLVVTPVVTAIVVVKALVEGITAWAVTIGHAASRRLSICAIVVCARITAENITVCYSDKVWYRSSRTVVEQITFMTVHSCPVGYAV